MNDVVCYINIILTNQKYALIMFLQFHLSLNSDGLPPTGRHIAKKQKHFGKARLGIY